MLKIYPPNQCCNYVKNVIHFCDQDKKSTQTALWRHMSFVGRLRYGHICPLGKKFTFIFIFFMNKLLKYITIRLHNLKSDTAIAHIEPEVTCTDLQRVISHWKRPKQNPTFVSWLIQKKSGKTPIGVNICEILIHCIVKSCWFLSLNQEWRVPIIAILLDVGKKYKSTVKLKEMALPQKMKVSPVFCNDW
jgi:hypothetical protein